MSFVIVSRAGINIGADQWAFTINGDPTSGAGLKAAIGSVAVQLDSNPANLFWEKTGPLQTDWSALSASGAAGVSAAASSDGSFRASSYGVPADGATDAAAALATLTGTTMPQTGGPYRVTVGPGETVKIASDVTLPATVQLVGTGGLIKPASAKRLTISAQPTASGQLFDLSAGGLVRAARPMTMQPAWFGADLTGVASATAAVQGAVDALTTANAGRVYFPAGNYLMDGYTVQIDGTYSNVMYCGDGPASVLQNTSAKTQGVATESRGMLSLFGNNAFNIKKITFKDLSFKGAGTSDATQFLFLDQIEDVTMENLYFQDNALESVRSATGFQTRKVTVHNCHATNVGKGSRNAAWMNIGAASFTMSDCTVENSSNALETAGAFTTIVNCRFKDMTSWAVMVASTWSGWLDPENGYAQVNSYGVTVTGNQFINIPDRALLLPDYTGHANGLFPTHGPAHLDGNLGQVVITGNLFDRCTTGVWGGADKLGLIDCSGNLFTGQYDGGVGPNTFAVSPQAGTWNVHRNMFSLGQGIQWSGIVGHEADAPKTDRITVSDNIVVNLCWSGTTTAFSVYQDSTIKGTRFLDADGTIAAAPDSMPLYQFFDAALTAGILLTKGEWAWWDPDHQISLYREPTKLPVLGDTLPATFCFKPGDVLVNRGNTAKWFSKKCVTGGTTNPTALTSTGAATSGTKTLTVSANTGLMQYGWISFPSIPSITNKQILGISGTTITVDTAFETTITAGTALSWATPVFVTDRDLTTLSVASQATGDIIYASSATAFARLAKGSNGAYLSLASGVPAWVDATARYDAGNSSTAITVTRTPERQEQKVTLTAATPAVTIDDTAIPSGGYLVTDFFQDATGSRVPTWALASAGTINWVGGSAPTLTTTAAKADRIVWHNEGSRITAWASLQNF